MAASNVPVSAGSRSYVLYKAETAYGTAATPDTHFGLDTEFNNNIKNNMKPNRGMKGSTSGGRDVSKYTAGKVDLGFSVTFDMNTDAWMKYVLGTATGTVYTGADLPESLTIAHSIDNVATDRDEIYSGCVVETCNIKGAEGEPVTCTLDFKAADLNYDSTLTANTALADFAPYTFSESTFELPNATVIPNIVNDFDITIQNNWTMHYGPSRKAVYATPGERSYSVKLSTKYVDDGLLNKALGGTGIAADTPTQNATFEMVLTRPDNATFTFLFGISPIDSYSLSAKLNESIGENIELMCSSLTATKA